MDARSDPWNLERNLKSTRKCQAGVHPEMIDIGSESFTFLQAPVILLAVSTPETTSWVIFRDFTLSGHSQTLQGHKDISIHHSVSPCFGEVSSGKTRSSGIPASTTDSSM